MPCTTARGTTRLNVSIKPVAPRKNTVAETNAPAATIWDTVTASSESATAAMVFMGCTGIGTSKQIAVTRLYTPVTMSVVPTSRPDSTVKPTSKGRNVPRSPRDPEASRHDKSRHSARARLASSRWGDQVFRAPSGSAAVVPLTSAGSPGSVPIASRPRPAASRYSARRVV